MARDRESRRVESTMDGGSRVCWWIGIVNQEESWKLSSDLESLHVTQRVSARVFARTVLKMLVDKGRLKQIEVLTEQVGELQGQNTLLVAKLGKKSSPDVLDTIRRTDSFKSVRKAAD